MTNLTRRVFVGTAAATLAIPAIVKAQSDVIKIGSLTPLTGVGGTYGPSMRDAIGGVIAQVNEAGGILGKQITLVSEDTQTSPEAAVRAARKLIDVDGVSAILGTWASSITTAVAPLAWESKTMLMCVSGADSITQLPHGGFICRTQPNSKLQIRVAADFMIDEGAKQMAWIGPQTPFAASSIAIMKEVGAAKGVGMTDLIYEADKSTYRSEVDQILRNKPDFIMLGGYSADSTVLLRDIWQAGYEGKIIGPAYAVNKSLLKALPSDVSEGVFTWEGAPAVDSGAYANVKSILGVENVDPYSAQTHDHASLTILAMAAGRDSSGDTVRTNVRKISQGDGKIVETAVDGLAALADGINYQGASGPCDFDDIGDITGTSFIFKKISAATPSDYKRV